MTIQGKLLKHLEDSTCWEFPVTKNHVVDSIRDFFKPCSETVACKVFDKNCKCFRLVEENRELVNKVVEAYNKNDNYYEAYFDELPITFSEVSLGEEDIHLFVTALCIAWHGEFSGGNRTRSVLLNGDWHVIIIDNMHVQSYWVDVEEQEEE